MSECECSVYTISKYLRSLVPNAVIKEETIMGILVDVGLSPMTPVEDTTERERDIATARLYIRMAMNPLTSQRVTERDADWEHSCGSEQWSSSQLQQFLTLARKLLSKWDIVDPALESLMPKWGMVGNGHHAIRKYK